MLNGIILVLGDLAVSILQGFYMGVGIRQSAGLLNVAALTALPLIVWLIGSWLLGLYRFIPDLKPDGKSPTDEENQDSKRKHFFLRMLDQTLSAQRPVRLVIVWVCTSLCAVFWQTWYWEHVLKHSRGISLQFTLFFCLAGFYFLAIWRFIWTAFVMIRILAKEHKVVRALCYLFTVLIILYQVPAVWLTVNYAPRKYTLSDLPELPYHTAVVFGAGVYRNGTASSVLQDRVNTAVALYQSGRVDQILMSGDNSDASRNEVDVMANLAILQGVPATSILQDREGLSTTRTCENAATQFGIREAILVTQNFHTTRALYTCDQYQVKGVSVSADLSVYNIFSWLSWQLRDWLGLTLTWLFFLLN